MGLLFNNLEFVLKYDLVGLSLLEHQRIAVDVCREHLSLYSMRCKTIRVGYFCVPQCKIYQHVGIFCVG